MKFSAFENILDLAGILFPWENVISDKFTTDFDSDLMDLESDFRDEISENFYFLSSYSEKENLIKRYLIDIAILHEEVLFVNFYSENEEENEDKLLAPKEIFFRIKEFFQTIIDIICEECFTHSIDLEKINKESGYLNGKLNFYYYYEKMESIVLNSNLADINFKKIFTSDFAYKLFEHLQNKFQGGDLIKHSCIYRLMIVDKYIDSTITPERYKRLLERSKFEADIKYSLKTENDIGKKTKEKYHTLKDEILKK